MSLVDNVFNFPNLLHVQRDYNWDFILPSIGFVPGIAITKYCQSVQVGQYDITELRSMNRGPEKSFFPGALAVGDLRATFIAPTPDIIATYFHTWKEKIIDKDGFYGLPAQYKKNATIVLYDRTMGIPTNLITVKGLFPKTFPKFNLAYTSEDIVKHEIEFSFDKVVMGLSGLGSSLGVAASSVGFK